MSPPRLRAALSRQRTSTIPGLLGLIAPLLALVGCPASPVATEALRFACTAPGDCLPRHACVDGVCVPAAALDAGPLEGLVLDALGHDGLVVDAPHLDGPVGDRAATDTPADDLVTSDGVAQDLVSPLDGAAADASDAGSADLPLADLATVDTALTDAATAPDTSTGDSAPTPDAATDDVFSADLAQADSSAPDLAAPDTAGPDTIAPDTSTADTFAPDTAVPDAGPTVVETVISAATAFPDANTTHVVTLSSVVDPDRSLLVFSATTSSVAPSDGNVAGQLISNGTQVRFRRISAGASNLRIRFAVVELVEGRVQRGTATMNAGVFVTGPVIAAVDRSRSFALHSWMIQGSNYNSNDFYRADLPDDTHVRIRRADSEDQATIEWQVVELPAAATVVSLDFTLSTSDLTKDLALSPAIDLGQSFALVSYEVSDFTANDVKSNAVRGLLHDGSTLRLSRGDNNVSLAGTAFVAQWPALDVRHGEVSLVDGESERRSSLSPAVVPARSVVFAPSIQKQGETSLSEGSDHIGGVWMTCDLSSDGSEVIVTRGHGAGASILSWTVVQFP